MSRSNSKMIAPPCISVTKRTEGRRYVIIKNDDGCSKHSKIYQKIYRKIFDDEGPESSSRVSEFEAAARRKHIVTSMLSQMAPEMSMKLSKYFSFTDMHDQTRLLENMEM
jgi:hypothetical protein